MADLITIITVVSVIIYIGIELKVIQPRRIKRLMDGKNSWRVPTIIKTECLSEDIAIKFLYYECLGCYRRYEANYVGELQKCSCGMKWRLTEIKDRNAIIKIAG